MTEIDRILSANIEYAANHVGIGSPRPARGLAVLTCMDVRIDVLPILGLSLGDAHVLRNAGARVTDDVLRSLALSSHAFGVDTVLVIQHTQCGVANSTNEEFQALTGSDQDFLAIDDQRKTVQEDLVRISNAPYLAKITSLAGLIYDVDTGRVEEVARSDRA